MSAFVDAFRSKRVALCIAIGFASGLPLYMRGSTLTTWMRTEGVNLKAIGLFTLIGFIYTFKLLWAPLIDRYAPPFLGRRRGWMFLLQLGLIAGIASLGAVGGSKVGMAIVVVAAVVTFMSATHDIAIDAYRVDLLRPNERASGSAVYTLGYRGAALTAGAFALFLADHGVSWPVVFWIMAGAMAVGFIPSLLGPEPDTVPAPRTLQAAVVEPWKDFFGRRGSLIAIAFIMLYKVGDYLSTEVVNLFLVDMKYSLTEIAFVMKTVSMVATIVGVMLGGGLVAKLGVHRSLIGFGVLQALTNSGYFVIAVVGKNTALLGVAVAIDWFCNGLAAAAFAAYQISLCNKRYSATQFAIIASASTVLGRLFTGLSGFIIAHTGWATFFVYTIIVAIPGVLLAAFGPIHRAAVPTQPAPATVPPTESKPPDQK